MVRGGVLRRIDAFLREQTRYFDIAFAATCRLGRRTVLVVKFRAADPEERFRLRLDIASVLDLYGITIIDADDVPPPCLKHLLRRSSSVHVYDPNVFGGALRTLSRVHEESCRF
ncbi:MAG: hypothetical protein DRO39_09785 [Thermoprotei archaeon]|nr:MAG: hypothetical protein DRO39_09785 [Thermoprotei archaeon]